MREPIDWRKILADKDSRIRYYNSIWILAQLIEQLKQESEEANKILEKCSYDVLEKDYTLSNKHSGRKANQKQFGKDVYGQTEGIDYFWPGLSSERELLGEATVTDKEVRIIIEIPGVSEENIAINVYQAKLVIIAVGDRADYCGSFNLPDTTNTTLWKQSFSNGILEIIFKNQNIKN